MQGVGQIPERDQKSPDKQTPPTCRRDLDVGKKGLRSARGRSGLIRRKLTEGVVSFRSEWLFCRVDFRLHQLVNEFTVVANRPR